MDRHVCRAIRQFSRAACRLQERAAALAASRGAQAGRGNTERQPDSERKRSLSLPTVAPPTELQEALKKVLSCYSSKTLVHDGQSLMRYLHSRVSPTQVDESRRRKGELSTDSNSPWDGKRSESHSRKGTFPKVLRYGRREALAYAAGGLQAAYGTTLRVFSEIARRDASFTPETLLDFGSGLGTAVWAANQLWGSSIYEYQCVDISQEMGQLAEALRTGGEISDSEVGGFTSSTVNKNDAIPGVYFRQYLPVSGKVQYDLVVSAYTLGELPSVKLRKLTLASLWRKAKEYLVLIEPGNWSGYQNIIEARDVILKASGLDQCSDQEEEPRQPLVGHIFAPCPHDLSCPLLASEKRTPCFFAQRVQLAHSEKNTPLKHKGFHIENFSYVVFKKGARPSEAPTARLITPIRKRSRHLICNACCPNGEMRHTVLTKSKHGSLYREARQSEWGDTLSAPLPEFDRSHHEEEENLSSIA